MPDVAVALPQLHLLDHGIRLPRHLAARSAARCDATPGWREHSEARGRRRPLRQGGRFAQGALTWKRIDCVFRRYIWSTYIGDKVTLGYAIYNRNISKLPNRSNGLRDVAVRAGGHRKLRPVQRDGQKVGGRGTDGDLEEWGSLLGLQEFSRKIPCNCAYRSRRHRAPRELVAADGFYWHHGKQAPSM